MVLARASAWLRAACLVAVAFALLAAPASAQVTAPLDDPPLDLPEAGAPDDLVPPEDDDDGGNGWRDRDRWPDRRDRPDRRNWPQVPVDPGVANPFPVPLPLPEPEVALPPVTSTFVAGTVARMRTDGKAAIPRGAPKRVRALIAQYNRIVGKRYKWGGGHAKLEDKGYDCSGAVGYGLIKAGMLRGSMVSGTFARWAAAGKGRWMTIYANKGHVYTEIAGLRLDTSPVGDNQGHGVRWRPLIGQRRGFTARHPVGL